MENKEPDERLKMLISLSDKLEEKLTQAVEEISDVKSYKDLTAAIKDAISIRRDLLGISSEQKSAKEKQEDALIKVEITPPEYAE